MQTIETQIQDFIKSHFDFEGEPVGAYASIGGSIGSIRIAHTDHRTIPRCWNLMAKLEHFLMDLTGGDLLDITVHLLCNQYDLSGTEHYTFTITFTIE